MPCMAKKKKERKFGMDRKKPYRCILIFTFDKLTKRLMNRYVTTILALFVFLVYTNSAQTQPKVLTNANPSSSGFSATRLARLDSGMSDWVKNKWVNGAVAFIARN